MTASGVRIIGKHNQNVPGGWIFDFLLLDGPSHRLNAQRQLPEDTSERE
jgi:hypothetical protein